MEADPLFSLSLSGHGVYDQCIIKLISSRCTGGPCAAPTPPTRVAPLPRDIQLRLSQRGMTGVGSLSSACSSPDPGGTRETTLNSPWGYWGPPLHNMGLCSRLGGGPNAWKHFGPELDPGAARDSRTQCMHTSSGFRHLPGRSGGRRRHRLAHCIKIYGTYVEVRGVL